MSADDGIYVLQTYGPEYRIIHAQAIDNIYSEYIVESHTWTPDVDAIVNHFGKSKVYKTLDEAWDFALQMEEDVGYCEYGLCLIRDFREYDFSDFVERATKNG
jgi:hypothetical protein